MTTITDIFFDDNGEETLVERMPEYDILPISVIDIEAQGVRIDENHTAQSSRANYSPFPKEIASLCCNFYLKDKKHIVDPFAGWGERHLAAIAAGKKYTGFDISQTAIDSAYKNHGVKNILADSRTVEIPSFDALLTCPPYWDLEKYDSSDGLDQCKTWNYFLILLGDILTRFYNAAEPNAVFCIMVGDWRKKHIYYDLEFQVSLIMKQLGASIIDKIVVSRKKISKIKIMLPQAKKLGYTVRVHENLLVFRKPESQFGE